MSTPIGRSGQTRSTPTNQTANAIYSSPSKMALFDDFLGDVIADQWNVVEGTDSATSDVAILAGGIGGLLRMTTGDAGTGLAADMPVLNAALQWKAANGGLYMEARLKMSQITEVYMFVGFTDKLTLEAPVISAGSADTFTTNASNAVGFMFDTRMATDKFWLTGVKGDVDAVHQNSLVAPVADTFVTLRVEVANEGSASFFVNGVGVGTVLLNAVTVATALTPVVAFGKLSTAASATSDIDYINCAANRV